MIAEKIQAFAGKIISAAGESRILTAVSRDVSDEVFRRAEPEVSAVPPVPGGFRIHSSRLYRFRMRILRWQSESRIISGIRKLTGWVLEQNTVSMGIFLLVAGTVSACFRMLSGERTLLSSAILFSLFLVISSVPLLHARENLSATVRNGVILRLFLIDFCDLREVIPDGESNDSTTGSGSSTAVFLGVLYGISTVFLHPALLFLLFLVPVAVLLLCVVPELPLFLSFLMLPFLNLLPHSTVMLAVWLTVCDLTCFGKVISGKRQFTFGRTDLLVLLLSLLFAAGGLFSAVGFNISGLMNAFLLCSAWFPVRTLLGSARRRRQCFGALMLSSFSCALVGVAQYLLGKGEMRWVDATRFRDIGGRVCGLFDNPNVLAVFLLLTVPLFVQLFSSASGAVKKCCGAAGILTGTLCTVFTWSRGAWLGWLVCVFLFLLLCSRGSLAFLCVLPLPAFTALPFLPHSISNRFLSIGSLTESSVHYRLYTWRGILRMIRAHPFGIGVGEDVFHAVYPAYAVSGTESVMHAHQIFLQIPVELGIPGLIVFLWILARLFRQIASFCRREHRWEERLVLLSVAGALAGTLTMGMFDHIWYHNGLFWLFWCLCAVLPDMTENGGKKNETETNRE